LKTLLATYAHVPTDDDPVRAIVDDLICADKACDVHGG
jgi:hypothetical protein